MTRKALGMTVELRQWLRHNINGARWAIKVIEDAACTQHSNVNHLKRAKTAMENMMEVALDINDQSR